MRIAAQLYTLRDLIKTPEGFRHALHQCAEMGFEGVQLSAVACMNGPSPNVDAATARTWLDECGLACAATHRPWAGIANDLQGELDFHRALGCDYVAVGSIGAEFGNSPDAYRRFLSEARQPAEILANSGIRFGYHNHSHEFVHDPATERPCFDLLLDRGQGWLQLELDTYWLAHAGVCPADVLHQASGRTAVVHLKDMEILDGSAQAMAPVGEGNLNWDSILQACLNGQTEWLVVEQDICRRDPFDCLRSSLSFLKRKIQSIPH